MQPPQGGFFLPGGNTLVLTRITTFVIMIMPFWQATPPETGMDDRSTEEAGVTFTPKRERIYVGIGSLLIDEDEELTFTKIKQRCETHRICVDDEAGLVREVFNVFNHCWSVEYGMPSSGWTTIATHRGGYFTARASIPSTEVIEAVRRGAPIVIGYSTDACEKYREGWNAAMDHVWETLNLTPIAEALAEVEREGL